MAAEEQPGGLQGPDNVVHVLCDRRLSALFGEKEADVGKCEHVVVSVEELACVRSIDGVSVVHRYFLFFRSWNESLMRL